MIKTQKHISTFTSGIDQDTNVNKIANTFIFDAENMRLLSNDPLSSGAETNVRGNTKRLVFDVDDVIIGYCKIRSNFTEPTKDSIVFFAYNPGGVSSKIYLFEGDPFMCSEEILMNPAFGPQTDPNGYDYKCGFIYANSDLNFSARYPIKAEGRYESANIRKVYWVDGLNNIRYMILDRVDSGDPVTVFDINPSVVMTTPHAETLAGGAYQSGSVQYCYQLYIRNGAATTFSPASELVQLTGSDVGPDSRQFAGTALGEDTGKATRVFIDDIDQNFNRIRILAIYYTEYLIAPVINIVGELEYNTTSITFIDNGYTIYGTVPLEEFRLFGQINYKANGLASKYNYLFYADITEDKWNPTWLDPDSNDFWDSRAVRFNAANEAKVTDNIESDVNITQPANPLLPADWVAAGWNTYPITHDGINNFNNVSNDGNSVYEYMFQSNGTTHGAEGINVRVRFNQEAMRIDDTPGDGGQYSYVDYNNYDISPVKIPHVSSQRTEVYRLYITFFNTKMQYSNPQWICDLRIPTNSEMLMIDYPTIFSQKDAIYIYPNVHIRNLPNDPELYGWQVFRCERDSVDKSVLASGLISGMDITPWNGDDIARPYSDDASPYAFIRAEDFPANATYDIIELISPEVAFNKNLKFIDQDMIRVEGRYDTHTAYKHVYDNSNLISVSLGATSAVHATDTILNPIDDGKFQSPGIVYGGTPTYPNDHTIGGITYRHTLRYGVYHANKGTSFVVKLTNPLSVNALAPGFIMGSYVRNVFATQYGGNTYEARSYNSVVPYSDMVTISTVDLNCDRGDTHITMFAYLRSSKPNINYDPNRYQQEMIYIPCESSINCFYRLDKVQKYYKPDEIGFALQETVEQGLVLSPTDYPLELGNLYRYNAVYSKVADATLIQNVIFDSNNIEHNDVKIISTGKKINNEYFDNWTNLYTNNNIEVDPKYGSIRNIFNLRNKLFVGQDKAIAVLAVNDRSVIQDNNKAQLTLGTGGVLERYDYLTTTSGMQDYFDVAISEKTFYYLDRRNKIIYQLTENGEQPISEIGGYRSFLKSHGNITDVKCGFDPIYKELFFFISDDTIEKTSLLNEYTGTFNGKHTFLPDLMLNLNDQFYSIKDNNLWLHNYGNYGEFYGVVSDSVLSLIINPDGNNVDRYDVLELRVDVIDIDGVTYLETEQFNELEVSNNYQTLSKVLTFDVTGLTEDTSKTIVRKWRIPLIPDDDATDVVRLVDTYLKVTLTRDNTENKKIVLHDIATFYRGTKS